MRRTFLLALLAALSLPTASAAQQSLPLMPGVTYERSVAFTLHGPVVVHVIEGPRPTGLYSLRPQLAKGSVQGRERLTAIERRVSTVATVAGVNGDRFDSGGRPDGLFLQNGVMQTPPLGSRSTLGIDAAGTLLVDQLPFVGIWRGTGPRRALTGVNKPVGPNGTVLFTPTWAGATPASRDAVEAVLSPFPATTPNTDLTATVTQVLRGGNHPIPSGGAVLYARGNAATRLAAETGVGGSLSVRLILPSPFSTATDGIGGGPVLVRNRRPVFRANEAFTTSWLVPRTARTAVGQRADGRILLVAVDGGSPGYSVGMTNFELAQEMVQLGAVTAMGLDSGLSTSMAFEGDLLNRPTRAERPIGDALTLLYYGVQAPPPSDDVLSPNGDGVADRETLAYKLVRSSTVDAFVTGPEGAKFTLDSGQHGPGSYKFTWRGVDDAGKVLPEGRWTWKVTALDDLGRRSEAERPFSLNTTLKALSVQPAVFRRGSSVRIGVDLVRPAKLTVRIERSGAVVRTLGTRNADTGHTTVVWNGRLAGKRRALAGTYVVRAIATNQIGTAELIGSARAARR